MLPIYTRFLTPTDYGVLAMMLVITAFFLPLAGLGMNESVFKFFRDEKINRNQLLSTAFIAVFGSATILLFSSQVFFANGLFKLLLDPTTESGLLIIRLGLISAYLSTLSNVFNTAIRADRKVKTALVVNVIYLICQVTLSVILVIVYKLGVLGMIYGQIFGQVMMFTSLTFIIKRSYKLIPNWILFKQMLSYGLYSVPAQLMDSVMQQMGQYMIKSILSLKETGLYGVATRITAPILVVGNSMRYAHTAFFFQILNEERNPSQYLRALASFYIAFLAYLWVGVSIWGVEILRLLTPTEYHIASHLIAPIAIIPLLVNVYTFMASGIDSGKNLKPYIVVNLVGIVVFGISLYFLLNEVGVIGAAFATILTRIVMIIVSNFYSQKRLKVKYNILVILVLILFGVSVIHINNLFYDKEVPYRLVVALIMSVIFPMLCLGALAVFKTERKQIFNFTQNLTKKTK
jgi:O-antigen/teichoic acid export membrane protein